MGEALKQLDINGISLNQGPSLNYLDWNNQIAQHFFNPDNSGKRVWFSVEKDLIEKIARENSTDFSAFIEAVKKGPDWINRPNQTICSKASAIYKKWKSDESQFEYPPYIAYLALFIVAVNHGESDDFSESAYYRRLNDLIGGKLSTNHFKNTLYLWEDFEKWSLNTKNGNLGEFHLDITGQNFYIGIPKYQVVLKTSDRKYLTKIFLKMGWDSDSNPTDEEILQSLKENTQNLPNRIKRRIEKGEKNFLLALVSRVLEELEGYDENFLEEEGVQENKNQGFIVLCMSHIDDLNKKVDFSFRCHRKAGLPNDEFILQNSNSEWKVPAPSSSLSKPIEKFNIDCWHKNFSAESESGNFRFSYRGQKYKVFTSGEKFGISDWVSGQRYTSNRLFYLAVQQSLSNKVQKWGEKECNECCKMNITGLPNNWDLFKIEGVNGDSLIKKDIPSLSIDREPRIKLEGGIRLSRGNKFFSFAPPNLSIIGGIEQDFNLVYSVENKGKKYSLIQSREDNRSFSLPIDIPIGKWISVLNEQASSKDSKPSQIKFMLVENQLRTFSEYSTGIKLNCFGNFEKSNQSENNIEKPYLKGAYGFKLENVKNYPRLPQFSVDQKKTYFIGERPGQIIIWSIDQKKTYFIGERPGQIITWPKEHLPDSWIPSWVVQFKTYKKAIVNFLRDQDNESNSQDIKSRDFPKEKIKLWKKIIWHNRKRIQPQLQLKNKWIQFTKRAKNV